MKRKNKIIILFGGAFSPFHYGHLEICNQIYNFLLPDFFYILPYQKLDNNKKLIKDYHRKKIISLSLEKYPQYSLHTFELGGHLKSYSYLTCQYFRKLYPDAIIYLVIGTDNLNNFFNWKKPKKILSCCNLLHLKRKNYLLNIKKKEIFSKKKIKKNKEKSGLIFDLNAEIVEVSSSQINIQIKKLLQKREIKGRDTIRLNYSNPLRLINKKVLNYLIQHYSDLYSE